ncbi:TPA: DUF4276 family protein [Legionella pneumophila subsp. pneumophila]|uniref:DUF4276 family protein n=1 Tax=Legionella pneumophila TaxID=446 RepID=UPI0001E3C2E0|nr:DUF4276 family protein [Legionella pneumophila]MDW8868435.1 DUF4276 family protein [Legionella pneumophila]MDW8914445.1 DUF4276 family protein [Legionella pneumophila]MDW8924494.1 DUF4276 family protein [Legionella pneumophila]MDW8930012.1 DUF4276 family protein [Legionella pneumophila]MDW8934691.1 DUF4276 family protein [Legionella pneumophila]
MKRLHIICEGHTEELFVNKLLIPSMQAKGVLITPSQIGKPGHKGGNVNYNRLLFDVKNRVLSDKNCYCTILLDYYGLPSDFPGKQDSTKYRSSLEKHNAITKALQKKMEVDIKEASKRFIPYIQLHEFEGLLFSSPNSITKILQQPNLLIEFEKIQKKYETPEDINDSPETAPSKRIQALHKEYDKPLHPVLIAEDIGLDMIREKCPLFNSWVNRLEELGN